MKFLRINLDETYLYFNLGNMESIELVQFKSIKKIVVYHLLFNIAGKIFDYQVRFPDNLEIFRFEHFLSKSQETFFCFHALSPQESGEAIYEDCN
jgi:hypothetical protein